MRDKHVKERVTILLRGIVSLVAQGFIWSTLSLIARRIQAQIQIWGRSAGVLVDAIASSTGKKTHMMEICDMVCP